MRKGEKPHYFGHRERLRQRFKKTGGEGFQDYELLELLLTYSIPRKDVKPLAKKLIQKFGSLPDVLEADLKELEEVQGAGFRTAFLIKLVKEIACFCTFQQMTKKDLLNCPQAVFNFVQAKLKGLSYEVFMVIFLNTKNESIGYEILHQGTIDRTAVYPRRVVESALSNHATGIILVHNHPSGHPEPSDEDRKITFSILKATSTVDIKVLDHIIVGKSGYFSFAEKGIL